MKCPKCGHEIKDDHLYCDVCGEEIRIVPDFDATTDEDLKISLTGVIDTESVLAGLNKTATKEVVKEIEKEATKEITVKRDSIEIENVSKKTDKPAKTDKKLIIKALVITGAVCAVLLVAGLFISRFVSDYYSVDVQYNKAYEEFKNGQYDDSIKTLKHCLSLEEEMVRTRLLIADNYFALGKYDESNAVLYELLDEHPADIQIYEKIIHNYEAAGDAKSINNLLIESGNEQLINQFSDYIAMNVQFSIPEGAYDEILNIELSSSPGSTIYYTLDGSEVSTSSFVYSGPIVLDSGEYVINALAVNEKGITSDVTTCSYVVDFYVPDPPVIKTGAGTYNTPRPIDVEFADYDLCYYTVDGDDPTTEDEMYSGPLPMYLGRHTYKFAVISNKGVSSDVVSVDIAVDLVTLIDKDTATNNLKTWMEVSGKATKDFSYKCEQTCVFNNQCYYIINEYMKSDENEKAKQTGNHYAVDVLTGLTYRAILNKSTGEYTLEVLI